MDNNFDPDAYLAQKAPDTGGFNPDAYLDEKQSAPEIYGRAALRNFPLGQQAASAIAPINPWSDKANYSDEMAHLTEKAEQAKAQNKGVYGAGAVTGAALPMAIPFAGEAIGASSALMPALEMAGGAGAIGGGANAAAQSLSDVDMTKFSGRDAANTGIATALGATLGKMFAPKVAPAVAPEISGAVSEAAPELAPKLAAPAEPIVPAVPAAVPEPLKAAASAAVPSQPIQGQGISHKPVAADFVSPPERASASLIAQGLGGTPRQQLKLYIGKDPIEALNELGTWMKTADKGKSIAGVLDRPGELLGKVQSIHDSAGKAIGDMIEKVSPGANVDSGELAGKLDRLLDETYDQKAEYAISKLQDQLQKAEKEGRLDFGALQKIKSSFGKQAKSSGHDMAGSSIKEAYGILSQYMNDAVDQFGAHIKEPGLLSQYSKAKLDYKNTSNLLPLLRYQEAKELIGGPGGHTTLLGLMEKIAHQGSMAMGLPPPEQIVRNTILKAGTAMAPKAVPAASAAAPAIAPIAQAAVKPSANYLNRAAQLELSNALQEKYRKGEKQ